MMYFLISFIKSSLLSESSLNVSNRTVDQEIYWMNDQWIDDQWSLTFDGPDADSSDIFDVFYRDHNLLAKYSFLSIPVYLFEAEIISVEVGRKLKNDKKKLSKLV